MEGIDYVIVLVYRIFKIKAFLELIVLFDSDNNGANEKIEQIINSRVEYVIGTYILSSYLYSIYYDVVIGKMLYVGTWNFQH